MKIKICEIKNTEDLLLLIKVINSIKDGFLFRGVKRDDFGLQTSIERKTDKDDLTENGYAITERVHLEELARISHHYDSEWKFDQNSLIEIWAMMQHYGAVTRFLDFTYSIAVALFFAIWEISDDLDPVIWCFNEKRLSDQLASVCEKYENDEKAYQLGNLIKNPYTGEPWRNDVFIRNNEKRNLFLNKMLRYSLNSYVSKGLKPISMVVHVAPPKRNQRLFMQNGCFLMPMNARASFLENFAEMYGSHEAEISYEPFTYDEESLANALKNDSLIKFKISCKIKVVTEFLHSVNVRGETLFPDFHGMMTVLGNRRFIPKKLQ